MKWIIRTLLMVFYNLIFVNPANPKVVEVTEAEGEITSPSFSICYNGFFMQTWKFSFSADSALFIQFINFNITRCDEATLVVDSFSRSVYCEDESPPTIFVTDTTEVTFTSQTPQHCSGVFHLIYKIIRLTVTVLTPYFHRRVGSEISFLVDVKHLPHYNLQLKCSLICNKKMVKLANTTEIVRFMFSVPGSVQFTGECETALSRLKIEKLGELHLENQLSQNDLEVKYSQQNKMNYGSNDVVISHIYLYPISYSVSIGNSSVAMSLPPKPFDLSKYTSHSKEEAIFQLQPQQVTSLGPGQHDFHLVLQNNVSYVTYNFPIYINEKLGTLNVTSINGRYVGIYPHLFPVQITLTKGAPANITLSIREITNGKLIPSENVTISCLSTISCQRIQISMKPPHYTKQFRVAAIAKNDISFIEGISEVIESVTKIYDVYFDSRRVFGGMSSILHIYVKGDVGNYDLKLFINGTLEINTPLVIQNKTIVAVLSDDIPINVRQYTKFVFDHTFQTYGMYAILAMVSNEKESYNFTDNLLLLQKPSCLSKARIRTLSKTVISVPERGLTLSVDVDFHCYDSSSVKFRWSAFTTDENFETPKSKNEVDFLKSSTGSEIEIKRNDFPPGLYIIMVVATASTGTNHQITAEEKDYVRMEVPTRKMEVVIAGGSIREFGNSSVVHFNASISMQNLTATFNWFCAKRKEDLPVDAALGRLKRKGSCFGWKPLLIGENRSISINNFESDEQYFIRIIVTAKGYADSYADQDIILSSEAKPNLSVKCIANCKMIKSPHLPIILQSQCTSCASQLWSINGLVLGRCENKTRCKVVQSELLQLQGNRNHSLLVKGFNTEGNATAVVFTFQISSKPSGTTCRISPFSGTAYKTLFSIHCNNFRNQYSSIMYKFSILTKGTGKYLCQYGYTNQMNDFILPPGDEPKNAVRIIIDVCSEEGTCSQQILKARVTTDHQISEVISKNINFALNAKNLQRITQLIVPVSSENSFSQLQKNQVIQSLNGVDLVSSESHEQASELLSHVTSKPEGISDKNEETVWGKLTEIKRFIKKESGNDDQVNTTITIEPCLKTVANLMKLRHSQHTKRDGTIRMSEFSQLLVDGILPGDSPMTYESAASRTKLLRTDRDTIGGLMDNTSEFYLQTISPMSYDDVINLEVSQYKTKQINFDTEDKKVDHVTSVFMTTGWLDQHPVPLEKLYRLPPRFTVSPKPKASSVRMQPTPSCNFTLCSLYATATLEKPVTSEYLNGAFIIIEVNITGANIANLQLQLSAKSNNTDFNTAVSSIDRKYVWKIPFGSLPSNIKEFEIKVLSQLKSWTGERIVNATVLTYLINCMYWDDDMNNWNNIGCYPNTDHPVVACECDHFPITSLGRSSADSSHVPTLFASRLIVYPNKIDYDKLSWNLWKEFLKNPVIFCILFFLYSSYLGLWFWAEKADKGSDKEKCSYVEVRDNCPSDNYCYYVTMYVGSGLSSGTECTVAIMLVGTHGHGNAHIIQNWNEEIFNSGSVNSFLITTSRSLGNVIGIRVWCTERRNETRWYLQRIAVRDLETNECCFFLCNAGIANDSHTYFKVATYRELHTFYRLLRFKSENYIRDRHLWTSMFTMRPWQGDEISRVERLSSCYQLIFLILLTTLMFYGSSASQYAFEVVIGSYTLKWSQVAIGLEVGVLCFPLTLVVTSFFRLCQQNKKESRHDIVDSSRSFMLKELKHDEEFSPLDRKREKRHHSGNKHQRSSTRHPSKRYLKPHTSQTSVDKLKRKRDRERRKRHREKRMTDSSNTKHRTLKSSDQIPSTSKHTGNEPLDQIVIESVEPSMREKSVKVKNKKQLIKSTPRKPSSQSQSYGYREEFFHLKPSAGQYVYMAGGTTTPSNYIRHPIVDIDPYSGNFRPLPRFFTIFPWLIISLTVVVSSVVCVMYGMTYGLDITLEWLFSLSIAILNSFILIEPIKALVLAYLKVVNNPRHDLKDWLTPISEKVIKRRR
uniref:self-incompatibility-linked polycystic kidney disease protein-1A precursor n=1 Tax=Ciona intestinalis TaxID=7719 RepID=UPI0002B8DD94|nr:self-incompatibility-linked polycystic kidney disease protein-1A precursor [Ciona intestinalis]|eukprot:XP_009857565.1 self-incompatibility-linked polycystic kidney disease protein-1A [Ciona intestinalis]